MKNQKFAPSPRNIEITETSSIDDSYRIRLKPEPIISSGKTIRARKKTVVVVRAEDKDEILRKIEALE